MTTKLLWLITFQLLITTAFGQQISRQEADSMLHALDKSKPDLQRIDLLLNIAQFHILKPGEFQVDFDSAIFYMNEASTLNSALKSPDAEGYRLLTETFLLRETGPTDEARKMNEKAVKILQLGNNKSYLAMAYYELSWYYSQFDAVQRSEKIRMVEQSVKLFQQDGNIRKKARALEMLGGLYFDNDESHKAILVLQQALAAYDTIKHQALQGVYVILGRVYHHEADFGQALFYLLKALKTAHALRDTSMQLCNINDILGSLYVSIGRPEVAIKYAKDAFEIARKHENAGDLFFLTVNLAIHYELNGQPERGLEVLASIPESNMTSLTGDKKLFLGEAYLRIYLSLKKYDKVPPLIDPLLTLVEGSNIVQDRSIVRRLITTYYFDTNQYSKARASLMKNRDPIDTSYNMTAVHDSRLWYKLDSAQGDFRSAFAHLLFYHTKMDSILSDNRVRQLQVLRIEYETELKEDSIKLKDKNILLLTQQNSLQQSNLQQANFIKDVTITGIILAFVMIGMLYQLYRQKQKSSKMITHKNGQLQYFLTEKEWLLGEIHQRVKSNLQIVMSLLKSQAAYIDNEPALTAIHDSQHRVQAISLIHQKLYNADNVSSIDISFYIRELVSYLGECFNAQRRIRFELNVEGLEMDVSQAVPLGLILNEAITNSIKYAFPDNRDGVISISLNTTIPDQCILKISDDGIGMPPNFDIKKSGSLGMSLIAGLSEDLDGSFSLENNNGTTLRIIFVHNRGLKHTDQGVESFALSGVAYSV